MKRHWLAAAILVGMGLLSPLWAQEAAPPAKPRAFSACCRRRPSPRTRSGSGQGPLEYRATAGTLPLRDGKGERTAEIFHVSFTAEPELPGRPITFLFNGGPGAASAFLLLGGIGPRMVAFTEGGGFLPPPSRLDDNPDTWLKFTDLVFVDPVGTGYSRGASDDEETGSGSSACSRTPRRWRRSSGSTSPGPAGPCRRCSWRGKAMAGSARPS